MKNTLFVGLALIGLVFTTGCVDGEKRTMSVLDYNVVHPTGQIPTKENAVATDVQEHHRTTSDWSFMGPITAIERVGCIPGHILGSIIECDVNVTSYNQPSYYGGRQVYQQQVVQQAPVTTGPDLEPSIDPSGKRHLFPHVPGASVQWKLDQNGVYQPVYVSNN